MADSYFDSVAKRRRRAQEKLDKASPRPFQGPQRAIQGPVEAPRGSAGVRSEKLGPERPPRKKPEVVTPTQGPLQGTKPSWMPSAADPAQEESPKDLKQIIADIFAPVEDTHPLQKAQDATGPSSFRKSLGDNRTASRFRKEQVPDSVEASYVSARREMPKKMSPQDEETLRSAVFMLGVDPETYAGGGKVDQKELRQLITRFRKDKAGVQREVEEFRANRDSRSKDRMGVTGKVSATASPEPTEWDWLGDQYDTVMDPAMKVFNAVDPFGNLARQTGADDMLVKGGQQGVDAIDEFFKSEIGQTIGASAVNPLLGLLPNDNPIKQGASGLVGGIAMTVPEAVANYGRMVTDDPNMRPRDRVMPAAMLAATVLGAEWATYKALTARGGQLFAKLAGKGVPQDIAKAVDTALADVPVEKLDEFVPQEAANYDPGVVPDLRAGLDEVPPGPPPANQLNPTQKPSPSSAGADGFSGVKEPLYHGGKSGLGSLSASKGGANLDNATSRFGAYSTPDIKEAGRYADMHGKDGAVYSVDNNLSSPYEMSWKEFDSLQDVTKSKPDADGFRKTLPSDQWKARLEELKSEVDARKAELIAQGHDGIIIKGSGMRPTEVVHFNDTKITPDLAAKYPPATQVVPPVKQVEEGQQPRRLTIGGSDPETGGAKTETIKSSPVDVGAPAGMDFFVGRRTVDNMWVVSDGNMAPIGFGKTKSAAIEKAKSFFQRGNAPTAPTSPALAPDVPVSSADAVPKAAPLRAMQSEAKRIAEDRAPFWQQRAAKGGEVGPNGETYKGGQFIARFPETVKGEGRKVQKMGESANKYAKTPKGFTEFRAAGAGTYAKPVDKTAWYGGYIEDAGLRKHPAGRDWLPEDYAQMQSSIDTWNTMVDLANQGGKGVAWHPTRKSEGVMIVDLSLHPELASKTDIARYISDGEPVPDYLRDAARTSVPEIDVDEYHRLLDWANERKTLASKGEVRGTPQVVGKPTSAPATPKVEDVPIHKADPTFGANNKITTRSRLEEALAELNGSGPGVAGSGLGGLDDVGRKFNAVVDVAAFYVEAGVREIPELVKALRAAIGPNVSDDDIMRAAKKATGQAEDAFETGKPAVIKAYHGTGSTFEEFDPGLRGSNTGSPSATKATFYTDDGAAASEYAVMSADRINSAARKKELDAWEAAHGAEVERLYRAGNGFDAMALEQTRPNDPMELQMAGANVRMETLSLKNPLVIDYGGKTGRDVSFSDVIDQAKAAGHDGVIFKNVYDDPIGRKPINVIAKFEDVPTAKPPKAVAESAVPDEPVKPQGVSHAEVDDLRKEMGWTPRDPAKAKPDADLAADAKKLEGDESAIADKVLGDADNKVTLGDEEAVALGKKLTSLKQRMLAAKAKNDVDAFDLADAQAQKIADALDLSGTRQGRAFRARRFLFKDQEDAWTLNRRARKANQDQPLDAKQQANLDKRIKELEEANAALAKERDDAIKSLSDSRNAPRPSRNGPLTSQKRRSAALNSLRKLGIPVADDTAGAASGGMKSKRSGAINIPQGSTEQVARAIRGLVRSYADTGISKWDDVLTKLKADLPGIDEEQALFILSGKYKVAKVEADLAKRAVNKFMSNVQADAVYRTKPFIKKIGQHAFELFNTVQRSLQTTLDNSLALIQGRSVLMSRPGTWLKGVGKSFQALAKKDPIAFANKVMAEMENDVNYAKAVQAKLGLSDIDGSFSRQEEAFAGKLQDVVPGLSHSKAMATVLMNTMRWDLFRKMTANLASNAPAEAYEDIARYINVITGKGDGQVAQWLGGKPASIVSYAPRLYWSRFQHSIGQPIWAAKTAAGRKEALKGYGMQIAGYSAALATAEAFGWDVELDPRSTNFGRASKDGINFDLFHSSSEGVRVATQLSLGRISQKGNYKAPGDYGSFTFGGYVDSKASPVARTALRAATGKTYDYDEGKTRDAVASDYWGAFIPLSIQEMVKNKEVPMSPVGRATSLAGSFMGAGVGKAKRKGGSQKRIPPLPTDPIVKPVEDIIKGLINKK